ncbi:MAG: formate dehydrogenase accessory protein FdhE [Syntrophaceae bacterium]
MEWDILLQAYPADQAGIYKAKALRESIDRHMEGMDLPVLDEQWQEGGVIADILPTLARLLGLVWQETTGQAPAFDIQAMLEDAIIKGQIPHVEAMDDEALQVIVNHTFARLLSLLREKNPNLIPAAWKSGKCPFCGAYPRVAFETETGRTLCCPLCGYSWPFVRVRCTVCDNADHATLGYFEAEGLADKRVYFCRACNHYLKVIDARQRPVHDAETEDALSLELDDLARKEGFIEAPQ